MSKLLGFLIGPIPKKLIKINIFFKCYLFCYIILSVGVFHRFWNFSETYSSLFFKEEKKNLAVAIYAKLSKILNEVQHF